MKTVLITGAFGFAGANLVECLAAKGYGVIAVGRENSAHNDRCSSVSGVIPVFVDMDNYDRLPGILKEAGVDSVEAIVHLAWGGGRKDWSAQKKNVEASLILMDAAADMGVKRFIGIGSQAEYGVKDDIITEELKPDPIDAYGACKTAAYYLLQTRALELGIEFIWGRIFSLIGKYEPRGRMLPDLYHRLKCGDRMELSSCEQYWDYLDAGDAAEAITALFERGKAGEVYNICNGDYRPLKEFTGRVAKALNADEGLICYGEKAKPFISLRASSEKIRRDTGWEPVISFENTIKNYDII